MLPGSGVLIMPAVVSRLPFSVGQRLQRQLTVGVALANLLLWAYLAWQVRPTAEPVVLHYTIYFSIDRVGEWYRLFLIPATGSLIFMLNLIVGRLFTGQGWLPSLLLTGAALLAQLILGLATVALLS